MNGVRERMSGAQFSFFKPLASGGVRKRNWRQKGTLEEDGGHNAERARRCVCDWSVTSAEHVACHKPGREIGDEHRAQGVGVCHSADRRC